MKLKRMIALLLVVATMFTLVSAEVYAADYTVTVKSNDGTITLFTATVPSGTVITFTTDGLSLSTGETYTYEGEKDFLGFNTISGKSVIAYAAGMTYTVSKSVTLYLVDEEKIAYTIVGNPVEGATSYELYEKKMNIEFREGFPYYYIWKNGDFYYCFNSKTYLKTNINNYIGFSNDSDSYYYGKGNNISEAIKACNIKDTPGGSVNVTIDMFLYSNHTHIYKNGVGISLSVPEYESGYFLKGILDELNFDLKNYEWEGGQYDLVVKAKGEGYYDSEYSNIVEYTHIERHPVTYTTTNATITNIDGGEAAEQIYTTYPLSVKIQPAAGYLQPDTVTVTVDGKELSSLKYKYYPETGNLVILSVTGDVEITAQGIRKVAAPVIERDSSAESTDYPLALTFLTVANASGYSVYVDGTETTAFEMTEEDNTVTVKIKSEVFPKSATYNVYVVADPVEGYTVSDPSNTISATVAVQIATPVATAAPDLRTEEYPFVCKVTKPDHAVSLTAYLNGNHCGMLVYETDENGDWIVYVPTTVIDGSGECEIYFVAIGESTDYVESESSNRLTFTIPKLATPVIWLE